MGSVDDHPELAFGPNPFLECVAPFISFKSLPRKLAASPLKRINWQSLAADRREPLLELANQHFAPTRAVLEPASCLQSLLRRTLTLANPLNDLVRKRCNQIGVAESFASLKRLEPAQGGGMLIDGMTATGKSMLLKNALATFSPEQVINHGRSDACGFYGLRQCVYLVVDHASNGTRGGLLKRILHCLDSQLETDYFEQHKRITNIDSLLVTVSKLLILHRVAILCIDEKQESTFEESPWRLEFTLFYLHLMNLGVSIVLSGNPLAFEHLKLYSQVMRRFSVGGIHKLVPATLGTEPWWKLDFVRQAREFSIVEKWNIGDEQRTKFENENSGGLPGLFIAYHQEVQRSALRRSNLSAEVCEEDYVSAQKSSRFKSLREIAHAISSEDDKKVSQFIDIPPLLSKRKKSATGEKQVILSDFPETSEKTSITTATKLLTRFKSQQTREANLLAKHLESLKKMSPEDVRMLGVTTELINNWEEQMIKLKQPKNNN